MNNHLPSSELVIRPASFNDIPFIRQIADKTWPTAYEALLGKEQVAYMLEMLYSHSALEDQMKKQHYFFLALKDYEPVGFASFSHIGSDIYKLHKLYVLPSQQKTGLGKTLLETVETISKSMGAKKLQLNVNRKNIARNFYERNGFTVIKEEDIDIGGGYFMNDYIMEKDL
ncbi:MAG: GCN5-related N-acetyltransferase [Segetibacter sp.]|nr:GCN5-related N-acetyltransferase [Segetibacter sp.]